MKEYPKLKRETAYGKNYMSFTQLKEIKANGIEDTLIVYDGTQLMINVDIDKNGKACGVEIIYHQENRK